MPDRLIRDELLESDRWLGLKDVADRLAFVVLLLNADTFGNSEATAGRLYRLWRDPCGIDREHVETVLLALADRDLIRLYEHDDKRYLHIPRYRQRLLYLKRLHPLSPWTTDAQKQALAKNSTGEKQARDGIATGSRYRSEEKRSNKTPCAPDDAPGADSPSGPKAKTKPAEPPAGFLRFWSAYPNTPRRVARAKCVEVWKRRGLELIADTIVAHVRDMAATDQWARGYEPAPLTFLNQSRWEDGAAAGSANAADYGGHKVY